VLLKVTAVQQANAAAQKPKGAVYKAIKTDKKINFYVACEISVMSEAGKSTTEGVIFDSQKIDNC
jgi:hypothetical protein